MPEAAIVGAARVIRPFSAPRATSESVEGVVVLGMHRSGTSVVARLVSLLGLALCRPDDLLAGFPGNPRGHWESRSLVSFDTKLLRELDASWLCPHSLDPEELSRRLEPHRGRARAVLQAAHPRRPFVWKDPRACLLLPLWTRVLGARAVYILVARHPTEVSESLERRNGFAPQYGMALWERYTRMALLGSAGQPAMLCTYDEVLAEPVAWCVRLAEFLRELGTEVPAVDEAAISAFVADGLRRGRRAWDELEPRGLFPSERLALVDAAARAGAHRLYEPPVLPDEAPATEAILSEVRQAVGRERPSGTRKARIPARYITRRSGSDERSRSASLIVASEPSEASLLALARVLPSGSEVLVAGADRYARRLADSGLALREIADRPEDLDGGSRGPDGSSLLARGIDAAGGRTILISTVALPEDRSWCARMDAALHGAGEGMVGAALRFDHDPPGRDRRAAFAGEDLTFTLEQGRGGQGIVQVPLLCGGLCALDGRVLKAAGGLDPHFDTVFAALSELSLRLWRMGFRSYVLPDLEVDAGEAQIQPGNGLHDRLRIAALHLEQAPLAAFLERSSRDPDHESALARLLATDLHSRRALIDAVCAFSAARYFEEHPPAGGVLRARMQRARSTTTRLVQRWRVLQGANSVPGIVRLTAHRLRASVAAKRRRRRAREH